VAPSYEKQLIGQSNNVYVFVSFMFYVILTTLCVNKRYILLKGHWAMYHALIRTGADKGIHSENVSMQHADW